jgi:UDP-N-acetyl-D-mannosaminuronic acid dehydrogenase
LPALNPRSIVIVGGCGHVGLPLGLVLADRTKAHVTLLDVDATKVDLVNRGKMPFMERGAEALLQRVAGQSLHATTDTACLRDAQIVITVIGTPVDRHLNPTLKDLHKNIDEVVSRMADQSLLILRSTVYPGVTHLVQQRIKKLRAKVHLAFCPERIAEGNAIEELTALPQIVSAFEPEAEAAAAALFRQIAPSVIILSPPEAELAKLFSNAWRYLNFAISNQFYILAESRGLDFYRIHEAATQNYPRMRNFAKAGFSAGPCLLKDTLQLSAFSRNNFFLGHAAMLINEGMPNFIVEQLRASCDLANSRVAILGMAFKGDSDDGRDSLAYKLRTLLEVEAAQVLCTDPFIADPAFTSLEDAVQKANVIVLGAPHSAYKSLKFGPDKFVVDFWNFWPARKRRAESWLAAG